MAEPSSNQKSVPKRPNWKKRVAFSAVVIVLFLGIATGVLLILERSGIIDTFRLDDRVAYTGGKFLTVEKTSDGSFYLIQDYATDNASMVKSRFPVRKSKRTFRIILSGGSFVLGDPYVDLTGNDLGYGDISSWLKVILQAQYPSKNIEVINAAAGGQSTVRVREVVEDIVHAEPDLVILATGNNEGYIPATRFNKALHKWILYRALKKTIKPDPELNERSFFPPQDESSRKIENLFRKNTRIMVKMAKKAGVRIGLATLPINLKYSGPNPSVIGKETPFPEEDPHIEKGLRLFDKGKYEKAIEQFAKSKHQAWAAKLIAQSYEDIGQFELAKQFYKIFAQQIPLGRTRPSYNVFVRDISQENGLLLFDLEEEMERLSPEGIPGDQYFWDNCHLHWEGYYKMAVKIASEINASGFIQGKTNEPLALPTAAQLIEKNHWQSIHTFKPFKWFEFDETY